MWADLHSLASCHFGLGEIWGLCITSEAESGALLFHFFNARAVANSNMSNLCYPKPPCFCPGSNHKGLHLAARTNAEVINPLPPPSSRPCSLTLAPLRRGRARWLRSSKAGGVWEELCSAPPGRASRGRRMSFSRRQGGCQLETRLRKGAFSRRWGLPRLYTHRKESPLPATSGASCLCFFRHSCASLLFYYVLFIFCCRFLAEMRIHHHWYHSEITGAASQWRFSFFLSFFLFMKRLSALKLCLCPVLWTNRTVFDGHARPLFVRPLYPFIDDCLSVQRFAVDWDI